MTSPPASPIAPPGRVRTASWPGHAARHVHERLASSGFGARSTNVITAVGVAAIVGVGITDVATDTAFSHAVLYLLPVVAVTILSSSGRGLLLAGFSTVVWIVADTLEPKGGDVAHIVRTQFPQFLAFVVIVLLLATLRDALSAARAADLRSRTFLSDAAHQLRTPIASLQACAEALMMARPDEDREHLLLLVGTAAQRLGRLTNSLLQIARLDQGDVAETQPVDLVALCSVEVDLVRHRSSPDVDVVLRVPADPGGPVRIDPDATREAVANLLDNARRHARTRISVAVSARAGRIEIVVNDDGPGLPSGTEGRAFERFTSLDGHGGSGLGLPIARAYIERQGGQLSYEDGAFVIRIPGG